MTPRRTVGVAMLAGAAIAAGALLWRSLVAGTPAAIWALAAVLVVAGIVAFAAPLLVRARSLTAACVAAHPDVAVVVGTALPEAVRALDLLAPDVRVRARLTPVAVAVLPHGLEVWVRRGGPAVTLARHDIAAILPRAVGNPGEYPGIEIVTGDARLAIEFGPWTASARNAFRDDARVAATQPAALKACADYPAV